MKKCFVIQPFDNGTFDKRYSEIFEPAITKAGFVPYRVDKDDSVRIPIKDIEKGISESEICFAEITTDNPNVWYELGFAFAREKDVVMVCCSNDRASKKYPFDIHHRSIIEYNTNSKSDFEKLEEGIINKIKAFQQTAQTVKKLQTTPIVDTQGLKSHEIALLILVANGVFRTDGISTWNLNDEMNKAGYNDAATSIGVMTLSKNGMIETFMEEAYNGDPYKCCRLTAKGENWILSNQNQLEFRQHPKRQEKININNDLPF
jgi:nucleoside 2-deoxyribosyltransferase